MNEKIKNILLLSIEDLNDWIEPLGGHPDAYTPNLSRLAARGTLFQNAYTPAPACSPARTAALFGQAPWRTGIYDNAQSWAMAFEPHQQLSIVGRAKASGWHTVGAGKVFHHGASGLDMSDWDRLTFERPETYQMKSDAVKQGLMERREDFGMLNQPKLKVQDIRFCNQMTRTMRPGAEGQFWAHGIYRPHLPLVVPNRFFANIPQDVRMPPSFANKGFDPNDDAVLAGLPAHARVMSQRATGRILAQTGEYSAFLRAYLASIAFADFLVGRLLDRLDETGLSETTLIVLWSDHGWQLGEKLAFRNFSLWERALRVPVMMAGPGVPSAVCAEPISLLDLYPTLLEVLDTDPLHALDGQSLWPLLSGEAGRGYAISAFNAPKAEEPRLSASVRTATHRLIQYHDGTGELYDHRSDPYEHKTLVAPDVALAEQKLPADAQQMMKKLPEFADPKTASDLPQDLQTHFQPL
ncbi:MAG: sulfatase-like hydrolase/transferase [Pseudomonadota bacterium]